jgi:NADH pyrophosphatase NudC (nudix superfamily)
VIVNVAGKVLILRESPSETHAGNTQADRYQLPGETFEACLKREVQEETGLHILAGEPLLVGEWWPIVKGT